MTTDDDDVDDASLKSMRAVWLSMRDEEPPAAGMSALLAAAAEKAAHMRDKSQPWWQRAFSMMRRPPALAFATVMVLIGGAVLVTRTSDKKTATEVASPAPAFESRDVPMGAGSAGVTTAPDPETPADRVDEVEKTKDVVSPPPVVTKPPVRRGAGKNQPKIAKPEPTEQPLPEPNRYQRFEDDAVKLEAQKGLDGNDISGTTLDSPGRVKAPEKGTVVRQAPESTVDSGEAVVLSDSKKPQTPPLEQLARQAETAASRGDCAAVKTIVARIKQQDEAFLKTRLGKSAAVTKCKVAF